MILKTLKLENFGPFLNETFKFDESLNLISGDNGSGKSHITDAILFALYNQTRTKVKNFINWDNSQAKVYLDGSINDIDFSIDILIDKKDSAERKLVLSNESEPFLNSDAVKKLDLLLNSKLALNSVVKQGENDLISSRPSERRELLKKIYDINYQNIVKELDNEIKQIKDIKLKDIDNNIYLLQNKEYREETITEFDEKQFSDLKLNIEIEEKNYYDNLKNKENFDQLNKQLNDLKFKKDSLNTDNLIQEKVHNENKLNELSSNSLQLDINLKKYQNDLIELEKSHVQEIDKYVHENNSLVNVRLKIFDYDNYEEVKKEFIQFENNFYIEKENVEKLKKGICPVCDSKNIESNISSKTEKIKNYEIKIQELKSIKENLDKEKSDYENKKSEQEKIRNEKNQILQKIEFIKKEYEINKKSLNEKITMEEKNIHEKIKTYEDKKSDLESNINKLVISINNSIKEKEQIKSEIQKIEKNIDDQKVIDLDLLKKELEQIKNDFQKLEQIKVINEEKTKRNKELAIQKSQDEKSISSLLNEKIKFSNEMNEAERCKVIFQKEFPNYIISQLIDDVEIETNDFLNETYDGLYEISIQEKKDAIYILYGPNKADVLDSSKYEQNIFSNAYKYALWLLLNEKMSFKYPFILDEADTFASEQNSIIFYQHLIKNIQSQIIIITHTNSTKQFILSNSDCKLFELEKGKLK